MPTHPLRAQAFALAVSLFGKDAAADTLRDRVGGSLRALNDAQWRVLIAQLREEQSRREAPNCGYTQWQRIQYLRRQLGWTPDHLRNFMQIIAKIDHERFLDYPAARDLITGLEKVRRQRQRRQGPPDAA